MMPSQNDGVAMPAIGDHAHHDGRSRCSASAPRWCRAGSRSAMAITVAITAISSETGRRVAISWATGLPDHIEMPKSRRKKPQTKSRNCRTSGRSRPSSAWQAASAARIDARAAGAEADHADVARDQAHQDEHQRRRPDQRRDHQQHPVHDVAIHPVRPILIAPACPSRMRTGLLDRARRSPDPG